MNKALPMRHAVLLAAALLASCSHDWVSYNRTLRSERFAPLSEIDRSNVSQLKRSCTYEIGEATTFTTGLIAVGGTLFATTPSDILAVDAVTCRLKWRTADEPPAGRARANRGPAYLDGRLFRGFPDGTVRAYAAADGARLWQTKIADPVKGESLPASPIAWDGLVFIGNAGGDYFGVHGRMYALNAKTGQIVWESFLTPKSRNDRGMQGAPDVGASWGNTENVPISGGGTWSSYTLDPDTGILYVPAGNPAPDFDAATRPGDNLFTNTVVALNARTGAYRTHYSVIPREWHDWDVAAAPVLIRTRNGKNIVAVAPKDGHLYAFDQTSHERLYKVSTTTVENIDAPLTLAGTHFCPGNLGGTEWNGPAFSPKTNLLFAGAVDWCSSVRLMPPEQDGSASNGRPWTGARDNLFGTHDTPARGWLTAVDADTGEVRWKFKTPNVLISGITATAGGVVFFGDGDGTAYALDQLTGDVLWRADLGAGAGGGVITYVAGGRQRVAYAAGLNDRWPTAKQAAARIVVWSLPE